MSLGCLRDGKNTCVAKNVAFEQRNWYKVKGKKKEKKKSREYDM